MRRGAWWGALAVWRGVVVLGVVVLGVPSVSAQPPRPRPTAGRAPTAALGPASPEQRARGHLEARRDALGVPDHLVVRRTRVAHGFTITVFDERGSFGRVVGAGWVVREAPSGRVDLASGRRRSDAPTLTPHLDEARAVAVAQRALSFAIRGHRSDALELETDGTRLPVWAIHAAGARLHQRATVWIDAVGGAVLTARPSPRAALGRVFAEDPVSDGGATEDVELAALDAPGALVGRFARLSSCNVGPAGCSPIALATPDAAGDFLYAPDEPSFDDPFAEVNVFHHVSRAGAYFADTHRLAWECLGSSAVDVIVNYAFEPGVGWPNAAFVDDPGACPFLVFGQDERDFGYDADVVMHEYGHLVVDAIAGLGSWSWDELGLDFGPSILHEGTADYFAATLDGDPLMGEYFEGLDTTPGAAVTLPGATEGSLRRVDSRLSCPDDLVGEPHVDGRLWASLLWALHEALGAERADRLAYVAVASLRPDAGLAEAGRALSVTLESMASEESWPAADLATARAIAAERALDACERIVALDDGITERVAYGGFGPGWLAPIHYRIDIPADATALRIRLVSATLDQRYRLHVRTRRTVVNVLGTTPTISADASFAAAADTTIVIDRNGEWALPRCQALYLAVELEEVDEASTALPLFALSSQLERGAPGDSCPAIDASIYAPHRGDCGCRATPPSTSRGLHGLVGILAWLVSRRRRSPRASRTR